MPEILQAVRPVRRGVIGILQDGPRYLMVQRSQSVTLPGTWCFPGGHIEPYETSRRAIVRELEEELGVHVDPTIRLGSVRVESTRYILAVWLVRHAGGSFRLAQKEIADLRWVDVDEIAGITPGLASNEMVARLLRCFRTVEAG